MDNLSNLDRVKTWYKAFREKRLKNMSDMDGYIASCNIEYLIGKVERLEKEIENMKQERILEIAKELSANGNKS